MTIQTTALPNAQVGQPYSVQLLSDPPDATWTAPQLPPGLTLSPAGLLSGTPTLTGLTSITFTASKPDHTSTTRALYLRVN